MKKGRDNLLGLFFFVHISDPKTGFLLVFGLKKVQSKMSNFSIEFVWKLTVIAIMKIFIKVRANGEFSYELGTENT